MASVWIVCVDFVWMLCGFRVVVGSHHFLCVSRVDFVWMVCGFGVDSVWISGELCVGFV